MPRMISTSLPPRRWKRRDPNPRAGEAGAAGLFIHAAQAGAKSDGQALAPRAARQRPAHAGQMPKLR